MVQNRNYNKQKNVRILNYNIKLLISEPVHSRHAYKAIRMTGWRDAYYQCRKFVEIKQRKHRRYFCDVKLKY